jgi:hypothetical protein
MRRAAVAVALLSAILVLASIEAAIIIQANINPTLITQVVDPQGAGGRIIMDSQNNPHIFYHREEIADINEQPIGIYHALWIGHEWSIEHLNYTVGNTLIMDTSNKPHVVSTLNGTLKNIPLTELLSNIKEVGVSAVAGDSMVLDSKGTLHEISADNVYFEGNNSYAAHLYYTTWTALGKSVQILMEVNSTAKVAYQSLHPEAIVIDTKGNPHIIFTEEHETVLYPLSFPPSFMATNTIKYMTWTGSNWTVQTLAYNEGYRSVIGNMVLDSKGQPRLCYLRENRTYSSDGSYRVKRLLEYVFFGGSSWVSQTVESESPGNAFDGPPAVSFDLNGFPQVYFVKENYGSAVDSRNLYYTKWTGTTWDIQKIWALVTNPYGSVDISAIAFDSYGNPRLTYATVIGTYRSAPRYGELTYLAMDMPFASSPLFVPTVAGITIASLCVALLAYFKKRKSKTGQI